MIIDSAVKKVYELREKNQDYPDSTSEDYLSILQEINSAINQWESQVLNGTLWKELFTSDTITISGGTASAPAGFLFPSSLYIGTDEYQFKRPEDAIQISNDDPTQKIYWVTGGRGAQTIHCTDDGSATLSYYKAATTYSTGAETTPLEMSDPYFAVYFALAQLYLDDDNPQAQFTNELANEKLEAMKTNNESQPYSYEEDYGFGI